MGSPLVAVFAVAVVVAAAAAPFAAGEAPIKVCLNKINLLPRSSPSCSSTSTLPSSRRLPDLRSPVLYPPFLLPDPCSPNPYPPLLASASTSSWQPSLLHQTTLLAVFPRRFRPHLGPDLELHPLPPATTSTSTFGRSAHAFSPAPSPHLQPTLGAAFHLGVYAFGASTAPRWRIRRRQSLRCSCCSYPVFGPSCNSVFLRGPICNMAA